MTNIFAQHSMAHKASLGGIELTAVWFTVKLLETSFIVYVDRQLEISLHSVRCVPVWTAGQPSESLLLISHSHSIYMYICQFDHLSLYICLIFTFSKLHWQINLAVSKQYLGRNQKPLE